MSLQGIHIVCGYAQGREGAALLSIATNSITSGSPSGITPFGAPSSLLPAGFGTAVPAFEVNAAVDVFIAIGPNPDAVNGPRMLVRAGTDRPLFCKTGDKLAWTLA